MCFRANEPDTTPSSRFTDKLGKAMASTTDCLESILQQITFLVGVILQNWRALDLRMAYQGGPYVILEKECCFYINEPGLVGKTYKCSIFSLGWYLQIHYVPNTSTLRYSNIVVAWLLPLFGPILAIKAKLLLAPCHTQFLKWQISSIAKVTAYFNSVSVPNHFQYRG